MQYLFSFRLAVDNRVVKTIQLERSTATDMAGIAAVIGWNQGGGHFTSGVSFEKLPAYPEMKAAAGFTHRDHRFHIVIGAQRREASLVSVVGGLGFLAA